MAGFFSLDGTAIPFREGDSILVAALRAGAPITSGGCLCLAGDCPFCLATVDGVSYVRTCQTVAADGMEVEPHAVSEPPPLPQDPNRDPVTHRTVHADVAVIGAGTSGIATARAARGGGATVAQFDARRGEEVIGIYAGPKVVVRTPGGVIDVICDRIVVATGAAEIQPVCPGSGLIGLVTRRAAEALATAGVPLGRVAAVGEPPAGLEAAAAPGELVRFEGSKRVSAVVTRDASGAEIVTPCDTVSVDLGLHPRDALGRMGRGLPVETVGDAALPHPLPPAPRAGTLCPCAGVEVSDIDSVWERGFRELELVKRATLAGTGTCQGMACLPHLRSKLADLGAPVPEPFTARPVTRQLTVAEVSANEHHHAFPRTALDDEHRRLGATMDRFGGWWRPWRYSEGDDEYWAVRRDVSIGDVSTLGKMLVSGPGAAELVGRLYPGRIWDLRPGRSRYVLALDERGYVADDGLVCRLDDDRYFLTFTTGGATWAEMWIRDWAKSWGLDVRILNQTWSVGAINVTGPKTAELLARVGLSDVMPYMAHGEATVAGVPCRVLRLSFTGETSYELHHSAAQSVALWHALLDAGDDLGIRPHGIETLLRLRLEKGHLIVGQDTEYDSTPRRLRHEWAVDADKDDFIGKTALIRTSRIPLDKQLVGLESTEPPPPEGAVAWNDGDYAGYVTSAAWSPVLERTVMLAWVRLRDGSLPDAVMVEGAAARIVPTPFYDREGRRARA